MNWRQKLQRRFRALFHKDTLDAQMDEEMRSHIELQTQANIEEGMSPSEARYAALRQFGHTDGLKEKCRDQRGVTWLENLSGDIRYAARQLLKAKSFTIIATLTIALGVGVNVSMYSALQAMLMRSLPYPDAGQLVQVFRTTPQSARSSHSAANFLDVQSRQSNFAAVAALNGRPFNLADANQPPERVEGLQVSGNFFSLLGVQPLLGHVFEAEHDQPGRNDVVVLEHGFWQRRFAGDPGIIGRKLRLDGDMVTVIGVMPERFRDMLLAGSVSLWRPIAFTEEQRQNRGEDYLKCIARIKPGKSLTEAQAEIDTLAANLAKDFPDNNSAAGLRLIPLANSSLPSEAKAILWAIMMLAGFVLLIACANLSNLQFARTASRARELAVRGALGASRWRLARQLLTESVLLAVLGGGLGLIFAQWCNSLLESSFIVKGARVLDLPMDVRVLGFAFCLSIVSGLLFGLLPAWLASRADIHDALKQNTRNVTASPAQNRLQYGLIVAQVALALTLLAGASLLIDGLRGYAMMSPGWKTDGLVMGYLTLPGKKYANAQQQLTFAELVEEKLAAVPGAEKVALAWTLPVRQFNVTAEFGIEGQEELPQGHRPVCYMNAVSLNYFETLNMRLVSGRNFQPTDQENTPQIIIINETMARTFWPNQSPLGSKVNGMEVVGVVNDVRFPANPVESKTLFQTYRPFAQSPRDFFTITARGAVTAKQLQQVVAEVDPDQPVGEPGPVIGEIRKSLDGWDLGGKILTSFAVLGLSLAALGIYGVISGFVTRRKGEFGVRLALGAQSRDLIWLVLSRGLKLSLIGALIGLAGAWGVARLLQMVMPKLPASNPLLLVFVMILLLLVMLLACWLPARRTALVDPMTALRSE